MKTWQTTFSSSLKQFITITCIKTSIKRDHVSHSVSIELFSCHRWQLVQWIGRKMLLLIGLYGHRFILQSHVCRWPISLTIHFLVTSWQKVFSYLNGKIYIFLCFRAFALTQGHAFLLVLWKAAKQELLSRVWISGLEMGSSGLCFVLPSFVRGPGIPGAAGCRLVAHNKVTSTQRRILIQGSELLPLSSNYCSYKRPELWELQRIFPLLFQQNLIL